MPARQYPFIDIAVHARVREHFARGDAAILFSRDFARILWANDQGAAFFGAASIYDFIDAGPEQNDISLRQLRAAAAQLVRVGDRRQLSIRKYSGFRGTPLNVAVEMIRVRPDEDAVLFTAPHAGAPLSIEDRAARMIAGLDGPDTHMAVLDGEGAIVAHSPGFPDLGMSDETRKQLIVAVSRDHDWLIKRPVATRKGHLPAAVGKIADDPSLHLLFAVETILGTLDPEEVSPAAEQIPVLPPVEDQHPDESEIDTELATDEIGDEPAASLAPDEPFETADDPEASALEPRADIAEVTDEAGIAEAVVAEPEPSSTTNEAIIAPSEDKGDGEDLNVETTETAAEAAVPEEAEVQAEGEASEIGEQDTALAEQADFVFTPGGRAVRFVWKIDAEGRFSEISEEFATAVGPRSADVIGASFTDVAARYDLDRDHKIGTLLQRRDTWSGKTIFWPVEGTSLKVPVDLAALPTYSRSREFDGFRGFGIVRLADAVEDENANGLALGPRAAANALASDAVDTPLPQQGESEGPTGEVEGESRVADEAPVQEEAPPAAAAEPVAGEGNAAEPEDLPLFSSVPEASADLPTEEGVAEEPASSTDSFQGERPALRVVETPGRRTSDKVIELDQRRAASGLTRGEQAAFREIARQLGDFGKPAEEEEAAPESGETVNATAEPLPPSESDGTASQQLPLGEPEIEDAARVEASEGETKPDAETHGHAGDASESDVQQQTADIGLSGEILDSLPIGMLVHRGDQLLHANPEFLRLTAYGDLDAFAQEGGIDALFANGEEAIDGEPDGTLTLIRKDGQLRPVTARLHSIRWDGKSALMLALTPASVPNAQPAKDDEALAAGEQVDRLKTEIDELKSILETATDGVVVLGHDGDIRSVNRSASALFNYDEGEIRGKPFAALFAHESQKAVIDYLHGLSGHGVASVLNDGREVIGREANGGFIPLFMTIGRLSASNGFCAVIRDITQWKRTEEELRNAKRAAETANAHKTEFLARVSHEIRTPLNAIIGFSDMMASEHFGPVGHPRYIEYAGDIGRSGRHVLDIVNDLLDISKIEAGEMELDFGAVEINDAVSEAVSLVQPQANSQRVIIRTSLSAAVPNVVADGRSIKQIALNILANAIRFTPSGGQIVVSTSYEANGSVILRIRDTGVGMTRSELDQAMKPFRQVTTGARKRGDGTGLGLPLTKAMAEANRAHFSITSAPNEGTLVEISFPSQRVLAN
ncbi:PAS domain S-box protein [Ensifer adhaerens]|uniref:PAS domain S-box protein n=1 Tax=Ensifer adhaerens TaxID=106592 RepID=UPI001CBCAB43|nr:PAS domain S-box protein [Ensifer adhaerens]MBZ7920499.1 PAS domain S-box protein [Ensifer adhaerens]UAX92979.1 PAS domain S-box protein [Ensifer adhaerens]UAY00614.1 PAS domain S-box protein [Ensifer adhaerens]UAY07995.1 PAS domain S-box protein [Ensifer adhaerens]